MLIISVKNSLYWRNSLKNYEYHFARTHSLTNKIIFKLKCIDVG